MVDPHTHDSFLIPNQRTYTPDGGLAAWAVEFDAMVHEQTLLRADGEWTSGPSDLMTILGLHRDEVRNCRVWSWLLNPLAPHGFGDRLLRRFLDRLDDGRTEREGLASVQVAAEVPAGGTRADIVVHGDGWVVVVEAKILAPEMDDQCRRIESAWADRDATLVFVSRSGRPPRTGDADRWRVLAWSDLADDLASALAEAEQAGARRPPLGRASATEYLRSMRSNL